MKVFFWDAPEGNFGDDVNRWIWDLLLPGFRDWPETTTLVGVGSLIGDGFDLPPGRKLVVGVGSGYGALPPIDPAEWEFRCVRGPLTAERLGLPRSLGVSDPVSYLARIERFAAPAQTGEILFVPHWQSATQPDFDWPALAGEAGMACQTPCADPEAVIRRIAGAKLVLTESLHGAIVADAFRVPWIPLRTSAAHFNVFKWRDWMESLDLADAPSDLFRPLDLAVRVATLSRAPVRRREALKRRPDGSYGPRERLTVAVRRSVAVPMLRRIARRKPLLSSDAAHARQLDRYGEILEAVRRDYGG